MDEPFGTSDTPVGPLVVIAKMTDTMKFVGQFPTDVGEQGLSSNIAAPRVVWVPSTDKNERATYQNANPPSMGDCYSGWTVHLYGRSYNEAWLMRQALLYALRDASGNWYTFETTTWVKHSLTEGGYVCIQVLSFLVPIPLPLMPTSQSGFVSNQTTLTGRPGGLRIDKPTTT